MNDKYVLSVTINSMCAYVSLSHTFKMYTKTLFFLFFF